ncbi:STAS domain-containing protein [Alienimonas californiensis]|uniref:STAS domain-containing protein n=1 Tax=Alienimonas californiensis TaxID=2527989 RepID=A0A517PBZ7_9PLAN|nr:STAS domain-containing protein [Alienimonas californiensis]QDT16900.1 hypothetical protein CA12_30080 [Alienimonas californiensis]
MATERACRFEQDGNLLIITLLPELAEVPWADVEEIGSSLETRVLDRDKPQVIVDLTPLAHMGSGMVALVVRIWKAAQQQGGKFAVVNDHELVGEVLQLAGLADRWTIVSTRDEARKRLDVRARAAPARAAIVGGAPAAAAAGGGGLLAACGVGAVLLSAAALILMFLAPDLLPALALKATLFAGAVIGIVLGTLTLAWYLGVPRFTGVGVLLCSVALLIAGLVLEPNRLPADDGPNDSADLVVPDAEPSTAPQAPGSTADPLAEPAPEPPSTPAEALNGASDDAALIGAGQPDAGRPTEVLSAGSVRD